MVCLSSLDCNVLDPSMMLVNQYPTAANPAVLSTPTQSFEAAKTNPIPPLSSPLPEEASMNSFLDPQRLRF